MPRVSAFTRSRILQRFELKTFSGDTNPSAIREKLHLVRRDEMRHRSTLPDVTVQPEAAIHCVQHSVPSALEFAMQWHGVPWYY